MDETESASGGEDHDPKADGTSTAQPDSHKDGDNIDSDRVLPLERPITPGQDADADLEVVEKEERSENLADSPKNGNNISEVDATREFEESRRLAENDGIPDHREVSAHDVKAEVKAELRDEVKGDAQMDVQVDARAEVKDDVKTDVKTDAQVDVQVDARAEVKDEVKADAQCEVSEEKPGKEQDPDVAGPSAPPAVSPDSSPEDDISNVQDDPRDSAPADSDTGKEHTETEDREPESDGVVARSLVKEILQKALMIDSEEATGIDGGIHSDGSITDVTSGSPTPLETGINKEELSSSPVNDDVESGGVIQVVVDSESGQIIENSLEYKQKVEHLLINNDENDDDDDELEVEGEGTQLPYTTSGSPHPEYPLNYGNYKVCRRVAPGVKECLILETGEHVKTKKLTKKTNSASPAASPRKSDGDASRRSLSESSGESPRSDNEGERRAFKIVKTPKEMEGTIFMSVKTTVFATEKDGPGRTEMLQDENKENVRPELQNNAQDRAESRQVSDGDIIEISHEEARSERNVAEAEDVEQDLAESSPRGILLNGQHNDVSAPKPSNESNSGSASLGKPPVSPKSRGHKYPPCRAETDARGYECVDQGQESFISSYGNSLNGSYITSRQWTQDLGYHSARSQEGRDPKQRHLYHPDVVSSPPSSGPVPGYNTLRDQQVSWLKMFQVLEDHHRTELKSQYAEHQHMMQNIQDQMENELRKQQVTIQHRLDTHREMLRDASPLADRVLRSLAVDQQRSPGSPAQEMSYRSRLVEYSSGDSEEEEGTEDHHYSYRGSATGRPHLMEHPRPTESTSPLRERPATSHGISEEELHRRTSSSTSFPVRRSLEHAFDSPVLSPERGYVSMDTHFSSAQRPSYRDGPQADVGVETSERLLRGGVYSSPMPLSKGRNIHRNSSSFSKKSSISESQQSITSVHDHSSLSERPFELRPRRDVSLRGDDSQMLGDSYDDSQLSISTRVSLREKHARHLSDLRDYYEEELRELRSALGSSHAPGASAHERILREENHELKLHCQELQDQLHDGRVRNRDLEQRLHGLEVRANDSSTRYDESQRAVLTLRGRLEEVLSQVKDKDVLCADYENKLRRQSTALQEVYKQQNEAAESSRRDKEILKRLLAKYENLEKDHDIMKAGFNNSDRKLHLARDQVADLNKTISKLELHCKQLARENENLKHKTAVAMSMTSAKSNYEESYGSWDMCHEARSGEITKERPLPTNYDTMDRLYVQEANSGRQAESSADSDADSAGPSPLLRAEKQLQRMQKEIQPNLFPGFDLRLQKKFYGSGADLGQHGNCRDSGSRSNQELVRSKPSSTPPKSSNSPKTKNQSRNMSRSVGSQNGVQQSPRRLQKSKLTLQSKEHATPTRFDIHLNAVPKVIDGISNGLTIGSHTAVVSHRPENDLIVQDKSEVAVASVESTLSRVRAGKVVSRPQWENMETSLVRNTTSRSSPRQDMSREDRLKERLQTVDTMERRYDELQAQKRKLESALNRIPIHGRTRKLIQEQNLIETSLESIDREIGSVRMSLKRYQVLKSTI